MAALALPALMSSDAPEEGAGGFELPPLRIDELEPEAATCAAASETDSDRTRRIEGALQAWTAALTSALERDLLKTASDEGALAEIDFWRTRAAALSALYNQLTAAEPDTRRMCARLGELSSQLDSQQLHRFLCALSELEARCDEANEHAKCLATLERHCKHIAHGALATVPETLPSLFRALRMLWAISRHYREDDRMEGLIGRVAWELSHRVACLVSPHTILREAAALRLLSEAIAALRRLEERLFSPFFPDVTLPFGPYITARFMKKRRMPTSRRARRSRSVVATRGGSLSERNFLGVHATWPNRAPSSSPSASA